jgi:hypothetical protein
VPVAEGVLQRWPVSKRVNSSKAPKDDETLTYIDAPQLRVAQLPGYRRKNLLALPISLSNPDGSF